MKSVTHSIFKTFLLSALVVAQMHFAYAQTASILPPAKTTFFDANGNPLTNGTVESFIPSTSTHKTTWQDAAETIPNNNPLTLDAAGRALLLGSGSYRQVVKDRLNNVIWDQVTSSTGSGSSGSIATGDGDLVGTIKPWAGMTAPNQYVFTYGQEVSRTTFSALFTAITSTQAVFCNNASPILNGLSDTTNFWIGMTVELSCVAPGFTTVISKTATTVTLALNSNVTTNTNAVFFPWGRGNGVTTFNIPDFRGFAIAGNNNMGGTPSANLTTAFFGAAGPDSTGAAGGAQSKTTLLSNLPIVTSTNTAQSITVSTVNHFAISTLNWAGTTIASAGAAGIAFTAGSVGDLQSLSGNNSISVTSSVAGGIAVSATIGAAGAGYTNGIQIITAAGGTCTVQPSFSTTVAGNVITNPLTLNNAGNCTVPPANPAATTGGGGTGGTINIVYSALPFSLIQPTKTSNYIIKVTPDDNSATASGVTALGGMTGSIACGTGLLCTGNNVSVTFPAVPAPTAVTLGGVFSKTCTASSWFNQLDTTGTFTCLQPNFTDLAGSIAIGQIANNLITYAKVQQGVARSVLGVTGNAGANLADIQGTANQWFGVNAAGTGVSFQTLAGDCTGPITAIICLNVNGVALTTNATAAVGQLPGETSTGNAAAGKVGEYIESVIPVGSLVSLVTNTAKTITSISLTAGDWDVDEVMQFSTGATTSVSLILSSLSLTTNTLDATAGRQNTMQFPAWVPGTSTLAFSSTLPPLRFSLSGTTSIFLIGFSTFTVSTMSAYGIIRARRVR